MAKIGIFYGSTTGNTEQVAQLIRAGFGEENADMVNVGDALKEDVEKYPYLIFGVSTWGISDLQDDFYDFLDILEDVDFSGKKVALFGLGDENTYQNSFVDAMGIVYERLKEKNVNIVGQVPVSGYTFKSSRAVVDGELVGLAVDIEFGHRPETEKIKNWVNKLKEEFVL